MPGSKQHVVLDRKSLLDGCGLKVQRSCSKRLMPKRSKQQAVGLNERYFSSKFHGYDVKITQKACYHACKSSCCVAA